MYLVAAILKNGRHFEFWNFFRWLTGFIKRAISKEYVGQFWCLFPEMKDSYDILLLSAPLEELSKTAVQPYGWTAVLDISSHRNGEYRAFIFFFLPFIIYFIVKWFLTDFE